MNQITIETKAKVNLSLDVLKRREDNYHEMLMVMQDVALADTITLKKTNTGQVCVTTNLRFLPTDERNLAHRAVQLFCSTTGVEMEGLEILIDKRIPVAAGLAGGSTNAAGVLKGLNLLYDTNISTPKLCALGKEIGADVPYCIFGGTALAQGIGEKLTPLPDLPNCYFVIARPPISVSTKHVFTKLNVKKIEYRPDTDGILQSLNNGDLGGVARRMHNVLELVTAREHKIISALKNIMLDYGAMGAIMSGSGPSVFGIYETLEAANKSRAALLEVVSEVFVCAHTKINK